MDTRPTPAAVEVTLRSLDPKVEHKERTLIMEPSTTVAVGRASKRAEKNLRSSATNAYIDSPVVSRDHALLTARSTTGIPAVYIRDLGSMHGTAVNKNVLQKSQDVKLNNGDVIQFGADVVRDSHTYIATQFRFGSKPYTSAGTFALPDSMSDEDEDISEDDNSDISDDDGSSSVAAAYSPRESRDSIQPTMTISSTPKPEGLGTQHNPFCLADDEQDKPRKPVVIDLDEIEIEEEDRRAKEAAFNHVEASASSLATKTPLRNTPESFDKANSNPAKSSSVVPDEPEMRGLGYVLDSPSPSPSCGHYAESGYSPTSLSYAGSPAPPSHSEASSPEDWNEGEDNGEENESGSDTSTHDYMSRELFDVDSDNVSETSDIDAQVDLADGDLASDADESDDGSDRGDAVMRVKMHEMIDHAQRPEEEQASVHSDTNVADPVTPLDAGAKDASKGQSAVLPTPTTLPRGWEPLSSFGKSPEHEQRVQASGSMSLKNIMHQEKDVIPTISPSLGKTDDSKAIGRHPWDWSYPYDNSYPNYSSPRHPMELGSFLLRQEDDFTLTSSRFDNPWVGPPNSMPFGVLPGKPQNSYSSYSTCPPPTQQAFIQDRTPAIAPVANTALSAEQSVLPKPNLDTGSLGHTTDQDTVYHSLTLLSEAAKPATVLPPVGEKQKERTGMSIPEIVEPTVSKVDEPVHSKKRKLATMEAEDAKVTDVQPTEVVQDEQHPHIEPVIVAAQPQPPRKKLRIRKTAAAMAGIVVGTISAVGALAFLPDVFFQ